MKRSFLLSSSSSSFRSLSQLTQKCHYSSIRSFPIPTSTAMVISNSNNNGGNAKLLHTYMNSPVIQLKLRHLSNFSCSSTSLHTRSFSTTAPTSPQDVSGVPPALTHQTPVTKQDLLDKRADETALDSALKDYAPIVGESAESQVSIQVTMPHPEWNTNLNVDFKHHEVNGVIDFLAYWTIRTLRFNFDWMSGWSRGPPTTKSAINRIVFLESVAGVPGSIGAIIRHLASLRRMKRDNGWINTLWAEAENERMHLLAALQLKQPGLGFRIAVFFSQGVFFNFYFVTYLISPRFSHRLVGYLEEEAVKTYTSILKAFDAGAFPEWNNKPAPPIARAYWKMPETATIRDMIEVIRIDEAHHRDVNHTFGDLQSNSLNPYRGRGY